MHCAAQCAERNEEASSHRQMSKPFPEVAALLIQPLFNLLFACDKLIIKPSQADGASPWELNVQ